VEGTRQPYRGDTEFMHFMKGWARGLAVVLCLAGLASCAAKEWPWLAEAEKEAKSFTAEPSMSLIYLYREMPQSPTFRVGIFLDGEIIGALDTKSFVVCRVAPGTHEIASRETEAAHLTLETEPGGLYFVAHNYPDMMEPGSRTGFLVAESAQAKRVVRELGLMASACSEVVGGNQPPRDEEHPGTLLRTR